jgi:FkbM family methyltransferase
MCGSMTGRQSFVGNSSRLKVLEVSGPSAGLHLFCLRMVASLSGLLRNHGMQRMTWTLARLFDGRNAAVVELPTGGKLELHLGDGYWSRSFIKGFDYEPEIGHVLGRLLAEPGTYFLDCGANLGYWSVIASRLLPPGRVVALEASPPNYERLRRNAELNDDRFEAVLGAVWLRDGETLTIVTHDKRHAGSSVVNRREKVGQTGYREYGVPSITIDSLCKRYVPNSKAGVVIKLDVEGAEIQALQGAQGVLGSREVAVLYEDHPSDPLCETSQILFKNFDLDIFYCDEDGHMARMRSMEDVISVKNSTASGCNFHACTRDSAFSRALADGHSGWLQGGIPNPI